MPKCKDQDFPCQHPDYSPFDLVAKRELIDPPLASLIINESDFCTLIPIDEAIQIGDLTHSDYLAGLRGKMGLYHLWIDYDNCYDHGTHTMLCVYVGKGLAEARIKSHIKNKWSKSANMYASFYECSNRLSKYLEQLFLDTYQFYLNENENPGAGHLFAVWGDERHLLGTELHSVANRSKIFSLDDI